MEISKINVFDRFNIESSEYLEQPIKDYKMIKLRTRALIFLLDYGLFALLIYGTSEFIGLFISNIPNSIYYTLFAFYSTVFIAIEYYFDGTIFKVLFNMRSMSVKSKKLGLHIYILKFLLLRPIALISAAIYLNFVTAIFLWLFGIQKILFRFIEGKMDSIWYDNHINQIVTKIPARNG
jgi:hypothetical protein